MPRLSHLSVKDNNQDSYIYAYINKYTLSHIWDKCKFRSDIFQPVLESVFTHLAHRHWLWRIGFLQDVWALQIKSCPPSCDDTQTMKWCIWTSKQSGCVSFLKRNYQRRHVTHQSLWGSREIALLLLFGAFTKNLMKLHKPACVNHFPVYSQQHVFSWCFKQLLALYVLWGFQHIVYNLYKWATVTSWGLLLYQHPSLFRYSLNSDKANQRLNQRKLVFNILLKKKYEVLSAKCNTVLKVEILIMQQSKSILYIIVFHSISDAVTYK